MDIKEKVVVVTGGSGGIGRAMCERFARAGAAAIVVADLDGEGAQRVASEIASAHACKVVGHTVDVASEAALQKLVDAVEKDIGPIDLFCSNAGISVGGGVLGTSDADWKRIMDINLMAHVYAARILIPGMLERGGGYLVNTASAAGLLSQIGSVSYSVTKHAAVSLAEFLSITYGDRGIRVSVLCPQAVRTAMTARMENGGVAGVDGMLEPEQVAEEVQKCIEAETFLILPHAVVHEYMQRKAGDYDRWIGGMRRLRERYVEVMGLENEE